MRPLAREGDRRPAECERAQIPERHVADQLKITLKGDAAEMLSRQRQEEVQINAISSGVSKTFRKSHRMSGLDAEMRSLQVKDIDSRSMLIHIQRGKGGRDRYDPLSATLLTRCARTGAG
jgi:hypothetical protein